MKVYSYRDVLTFVEEEDVKFIRLAFCDVKGKPKNISIMPSELERAFSSGISFNASAICGFDTDCKSDLFLHPDPSTLSVLPWRPSNGRVIRMFCDIKYPDGRRYEKDGRYILKNGLYPEYEPFTVHQGMSFTFQKWLCCILFTKLSHCCSFIRRY